jgi:uncharacterized protein (TIGR00730 family)
MSKLMSKRKIMKISIFGGSNPKPGSEAYQEAYLLGKLIGEAGMTILTGGYMGTMEAASRGASESGGYVIGVTCEEIESWRPASPNPWVEEEWRCETLRERAYTMVENCDVAIALPGGVGTLLEICLTWNQLAIQAIPPKPIILIGSQWQKVIETFYNELGDYIAMENREYVAFAPNPEDAFELLSHFLKLSK